MFSVKSNIHTHTVYSDGKHSPEENILSAINLGMDTLGFSDHSYTDFDLSYCVKKEQIPVYKAEIAALKEKYADKIDIYCGIEYDFFADFSVTEGYDYFIGANHYVKAAGEYYPVDHSIEHTKKGINEGFGGNELAYSENYYENVVNCAKISPVYIAHFDLPVKYGIIDEDSPAYRSLALNALDEILAMNVPLEINTGAMARKLKDRPYPGDFLLKRIAEKGGNVILGSDSHNKDNLLFAFDKATDILIENGIKSVLVFEKGKLTEKALI